MIFRMIISSLLLVSLVLGWSLNAFRSPAHFSNKLYKSNSYRLQSSMLSDSVETTPVATKKYNSKEKDLSKYVPGQKHEGKVVNAKQFGVFVKLSQGVDALLPRSTLSSSQFGKLKKMLDTNSTETVSIEILAVDSVKQTISAKYVPAAGEITVDVTKMDPKDYKTKTFDAEIISAHDFGVFAKIVDSDIDGLVPASMLPDRSNIQQTYPVGTKVQVKVHEYNAETNKLTLSMKSAMSQDVSVLGKIQHNKWVEGIVQKVLAFGLIVRPAGYDVTGMCHQSQIPKGLINALKKRVTFTPGQNKSDVESLFQEGDVIKMRVQSFSAETSKIELSMQPYMQSEDDDDDYIVEGRETEEEAEEAEKEARDREADDSLSQYDPEDMLLWWKGQPYQKSLEDHHIHAVDEELEVVNESDKIVEGTWRRMFEIDMREDEADFSSKANEMEQKELEEEIGELEGLDNDMVDSIGFGTSEFTRTKAGSFISFANLPEEWKSQLDFFKEMESEDNLKQKGLRAGKAGEQIELNGLIAKMEQDAQQALQNRQRSRQSEFVPPSPAAVANQSAPVSAAPASE